MSRFILSLLLALSAHTSLAFTSGSVSGALPDNLGDHTADTNLNMAGYNIVSAGTVNASAFIGSGTEISTNELITAIALNGTVIEIVEAGVTSKVDIAQAIVDVIAGGITSTSYTITGAYTGTLDFVSTQAVLTVGATTNVIDDDILNP